MRFNCLNRLKNTRLKSFPVWSLLALLLSGCGIYFHDEGLKNIAVEAQEQADALDLPMVIKTARDNRAAFMTKQVELLERNVTLQANIRLAQAVTDERPLAFSLWESEDFKSDLNELGIPDNKTLDKMDSLYAKAAKWDYRLRSRARSVEIYLGIMPTPCLPDFDIASPEDYLDAIARDEQEIFKALYDDYVTTCRSIKREIEETLSSSESSEAEENGEDTFSDLLDSANPNSIAGAWNNWKEAAELLEMKRAQAREKLVALNAAKRELQEASAPGPDLEGRVTSAAETLKSTVEAFNVICETGAKIIELAPGDAASDDGTDEANPFASSLICGEKRQALAQLIEAAATGQNPTAADAPKSLKNAATIAAALPGLAGDLGRLLEAGRKVPLASLRLLEAQAAIDKEYADKKVQRQEERVEQARLVWLATMTEAHHLWQARRKLCNAVQAATGSIDQELESIDCPSMEVLREPDSDDPFAGERFLGCKYDLSAWEEGPSSEGIPVFTLTTKKVTDSACLLGRSLADAQSDSNAGEAVKDALAHYYLARQSARAAQSVARYRMSLIDNNEALDEDERALRLWAELIVVPVNSLARHYESGLRPEAIANTIVTGAGLGAIAVGVN